LCIIREMKHARTYERGWWQDTFVKSMAETMSRSVCSRNLLETGKNAYSYTAPKIISTHLWNQRSKHTSTCHLRARRQDLFLKVELLVVWQEAASRGWESEYPRRLADTGFEAGKASPCCFYREVGDVGTVVHGDDFVFEGDAEELKKLAASSVQALDSESPSNIRPRCKR
jgi:hypothetical protein